MKNRFICPECGGVLNPRENLILSVRTKNKEVGLILLAPELGNYTKISEPDFEMKEGDKLDIYCPICHHDLVEPLVDANLFRVKMVDENEEEHHILFSGILGEKCTYKITKGKVKQYGDDATRYINFENLVDFL